MEKENINVLRHRTLSLEGASQIGTGAASSVYLLPDGDVVKVLFSTDPKEAEREILLSKWAFLKGLSTAISYDVVDVDGHPGLLYESLGRDNLRNRLAANAPDPTPLLKQYLALIHSINAIEVDGGQLPSAKEKAIDEMRQIQAYFTEEEYSKVMSLMDTIPEDCHMVHGDCHIKNIKVMKDELFLIDLDTLSEGDPIFELSGLCCCYDAYSALNVGAEGYNSFFGIDHGLITTAYRYVMEHYYENISAEEKRSNLTKTELLTYLHMLHELNPDAPGEKELFEDMFVKVRERLRTVRDLVLKRG